MTLLPFLQSELPRPTLRELLACPWSSTCVLRVLPPSSRALVLGALAEGGNLAFAVTPNGSRSSSGSAAAAAAGERRAAVDVLVGLGLVEGGTSNSSSSAGNTGGTSFQAVALAGGGGGGALLLDKDFEESLRKMLGADWETHAPFARAEDPRSDDEAVAEHHARSKFTLRLKNVINPGAKPARAGDGDAAAVRLIEHLFEHDMTLVEGDTITMHGLSFMLLGVHDQVWSVVQALARKGGAAAGGDPARILRTLFRLSFCTYGTRYVMDPKDEDLQGVKHVFHELGLLYLVPNSRRECFVPTSLGVFGVFKPTSSLGTAAHHHAHAHPTGGGGGTRMGLVAEGSRFTEMKIIVETTMSVFAFVEPGADADIQVSLLSLFVEVQAQLPNMIVGLLTRESVQSAIAKGIRASQLIDFLTQNAHDRVRAERARGGHIVPQNVKDQLVLWGSERSRLAFSRGFVVSGFKDRKLFDLCLAYARRSGHGLWMRDDPTNLDLCGIFVRREGMEEFKEFLSEARKGGGVHAA